MLNIDPKIFQLLSENSLFHCFAETDLRQLIAKTSKETFPEYKSVFLKGDPGDYLCIVTEGKVVITTNSVNGQEMTLRTILPGQVFGELTMLDGGARSANAFACAGSAILYLSRPSMMAFLDARPEYYKALIKVLCGWFRQVSESLEDMAFLDIDKRMAKALLQLAERTAADEAIMISQEAIARMLSITRESANKTLNQFKQMKILELDRARITIRRPDLLKEMLKEV